MGVQLDSVKTVSERLLEMWNPVAFCMVLMVVQGLFDRRGLAVGK
jgi:hypothetical protein